MKFTTLAITLALATFTAAAPNPSRASNQLEKRSCTTATASIARVEEAHPVQSYLPGFIIGQDAGKTNRKDAFAEFKVPAGSYGCQLVADFPASYAIKSAGAAQVYVFGTSGPLTYTQFGSDVSWSYSPTATNQLGTVTFQSNPSADSRTFIVTAACAETMTYRLSISNDTQTAASVEFAQTATAGLRMLYNC